MTQHSLPKTFQQLFEEAPCPAWAQLGLQRLAESGADLEGLGPESVHRLVKVLAASPAIAQWAAQGAQFLEIFQAPDLFSELTSSQYRERLEHPDGARTEPDAFFRHLRRMRKRELSRIVIRETLRLAPVEETAGEISAFAEAAVETALAWATVRLAETYGEPITGQGEANAPCFLGMGKFGGEELNLSSDVDLLCVYRSARGTTTGGSAGRLEPRAYFAKLVSLVSDALAKVTEDGIVFRVDLDLRPEGRSGELAQPLDNALLYYQSWGQTWERAALMKARPVAGELQLGWSLLDELEPFVYRRSLDYTTVEDIKEMKRRIDQSAARRLGRDDDLKLGRGGIRELEFFVQTLQLIHGGKIPEVRERSTLKALGRLARAGVIESALAEGLAHCYRVLRTLEHAIQALHFRQTHRLPSSADELSALARRMGFAGESRVLDLNRMLDDVRSEVHSAYGRLVHGAAREWEDEEPDVKEARELLTLDPGGYEVGETLRKAGFHDETRALEGLRLLREGPPRTHPSPRARKILERIGPFLLGAVSRSPDPDRALLHLGEFLAGSGARASYLSLLEENPATARLLVALFGTSEFLSRYLVGHPELLDELVLGSHGDRDKSHEEMARELTVAMARGRDDEERLETLRRFRNTEFLRIALNDLWGALGPADVGRQITRVAEVCLEEAYRQALQRLVEKYGTPFDERGEAARFAVLGLGKLGGHEIDYHSDLDVLFLYSGAGSSNRSDGSSGLSNTEFFARLAQRIMGALTTRTREGIVFRMDARLRPSGQAGPLVTSLTAFENYHREGSQVWEKQALVKLRAVAGDSALGKAAENVARDVLYAGPPQENPAPEILRMRERIAREIGREGEGRIDLKAGPGGLLDVEFVVQALQCVHGWSALDLQSTNTVEALAALRRHGLLSRPQGEALSEGYHFLRKVEARLRVLHERPTDTLPRQESRLVELAKGLGYIAEGGGGALLDDILRHRNRVRSAFEEVLGGGKA